MEILKNTKLNFLSTKSCLCCVTGCPPLLMPFFCFASLKTQILTLTLLNDLLTLLN